MILINPNINSDIVNTFKISSKLCDTLFTLEKE